MSKYNPEVFSQNMALFMDRLQRVTAHMIKQGTQDQSSPMATPPDVAAAFFEVGTRLLTNPAKLAEAQNELMQSYFGLWKHTMSKLAGEETTPMIEPADRDRRFKDEAWEENAAFDAIKQSYLLTGKWMQDLMHDAEDVDPKIQQKAEFYVRQAVDAMSPSNFAALNPAVLKETLESNGENLVKGIDHMLDDLERSKGMLQVSMSNKDAFEVGKNIATTPGKVVFQNDLMQLIQYSPTTEKVHEVPLLIIPPWINKYYILDLKPQNSFVRWAVEQGFTVFIISWVNPDESLKECHFEDYMLQGPLAAFEAIKQATGYHGANVIAYCLGGTLMSATLSYMKQKKIAAKVPSVTYFTTLTDFGQPGELGIFIDEEQLSEVEKRMDQDGFYDGREMSAIFNSLRANDLVWSFVVNNYLMGKDPFPFDMLFWNADSTRMPAAMHRFYLRNMYLNNKLSQPGGIKLCGVPIHLQDVDTPTFMLSTREDHIAPWQSTYQATKLFKGPLEFVLAGSGHVAGVINPPSKPKYPFWVNKDTTLDANRWLAKAKEHQGSWWEYWAKWQKKHAGELTSKRTPGDGKLNPIENAPGSYVKVRY